MRAPGPTRALLLLIIGLAVAHTAGGWLITAMAGLDAQNAVLGALAALLTFPVQHLPEFFHASLARSLISSLLCSLLVVGSIALGLHRLHRKAGRRGLLLGWAGLGMATMTAGYLLAHPAPDWSELGHRYLHRHYLMLPVPIQESQAEKASAWQIHQNLWPDKPFRPASFRWYWNYSPSLSGHPTYDAVVVAAELDQAPDLQTFLGLFGDQRDPALRSAAWQGLHRDERRALETMIPYRAPLPSTERDRVIRAYTLQPVGQVWIGILARESAMPRERLLEILDQAMASVRPMSSP